MRWASSSLSCSSKVLDLVPELGLDLGDGPGHLVPGGDIVAGRIDGHVGEDLFGHAGHGVDLGDPVDLVAEELHPDGLVPPVGRVDVDGVAPDPEVVALEGHIVAGVVVLHQPPLELGHLHGHAGPEGDHHFGEVVGLAQAVDAADRGHDDDVPPLQQGAGGAEPQTVDLVVGGGVLFDVGVGVGNVGLRLVVVVVADEVFHGVFGEKLPELGAELGSQGLVVGQHQGRAVEPLDDVGHGEGLAGAGDAQHHLLMKAQLDAPGQGLDGLRLVAGGLVGGVQLEVHGSPPISYIFHNWPLRYLKTL